jgi:hypothetical protein
MRGALLIVVVIALLIVGVLVMKNMGTGPSGSTNPSQAKQTIDRAQDAAEEVSERIGLTQQQLDKSE